MKKLKKNGRPEIEIKRTIRKEILFSEEEMKLLNELFKESVFHNMNDMLRSLILKNEHKVITLDNDARNQRGVLIQEVKRIGNNFNQLIRALNQKKIESLTQNEKTNLIFLLNSIKKVYIDIDNKIEDI